MSATADLAKPPRAVPHALLTVARIALFWAAAAALVALVDGRVEPLVAALAIKAVAIVAVAFLYMSAAGRAATLDHALFAGVSWLALSIGAELVSAGKIDLLVRTAMMFTWIVAPALFARR